MKYKTIEPCKTKKGFQGIPEIPIKINLTALSENLPKYLPSFKLVRLTKVAVLFKDQESGYRLSIYPTGKAFAFEVEKKEKALEIFNKISQCITELNKS